MIEVRTTRNIPAEMGKIPLSLYLGKSPGVTDLGHGQDGELVMTNVKSLGTLQKVILSSPGPQLFFFHSNVIYFLACVRSATYDGYLRITRHLGCLEVRYVLANFSKVSGGFRSQCLLPSPCFTKELSLLLSLFKMLRRYKW